ncbi:type II toxin-antitoxin system death-on-curing family toxin [Cellulomonas triticagri]|uniref:Type II toxin-antitoxin system death-on-curing family toxin n=1 Tax=Cellulomonas triticagri TaxID=2483352 RepID=A0A3M2J5W8_9CELL|nr:type II toxin-antitoxin system death-on-curing family toxin [Cellulomonas triticagri]RMI06923.1 type II toxin-antitoxin system death-on-curing family toxin [Cellulomonas triticagri]
MTTFLGAEDLVAIGRAVLGGPPRIRDAGALVAAAAQPAATWDGVRLYPTMDDQAAALLVSVVSNHPFVDGNKRVGWVGARLFYGLNGSALHMPEDDAVALVLAVADGSVRDVPLVAGALSRHRPPA